MHCVVAVETDIAEIIIEELQKMNPFKEWDFEICEHAWQLDQYARKRPDVLVLSRFLPGVEPADKLLKELPVMFSGSHVVLLVGEVDEKCKGFLRVAQKYGLENYVTGDLPGDRPYTLPVALTSSRDGDSIELIEDPEEVQQKTPPDDTPDYTQKSFKPDVDHPTQVKQENTGGHKHRTLDEAPAAERHLNPRPGKYRFQTNRDTLIKPPRLRNRQKRSGILALTTSNKGGSGKTTAAITLAVALSRSGIPTVLADFDFEAPDVATFFDIKDVPGIESLAGRSKNPYYLEELLVKANKEENLFVLPGVMDKSLPYFNDGEVLEIVELLLNEYPVVIGDTPPAFWSKEWMPELLGRADIVFSIVDQSKFSITETKQYAPKLIEYDVELQNIKIVLNKFSPKLHNARTVEKYFCAGFKGRVSPKEMPRVVATIPEDWDMYNKYVYKGQVVGLDDDYSQWYRLAEEVAEKAGFIINKPKKNKKPLLKWFQKGPKK